jgi:hypothetical protein
MSSYPVFRKSAQGIPNRRSVFPSPDANKPRSPLRTLLSNDNMVPTKRQKLSLKRLKPKRLIVESEEDSSDSGIFSLREEPVVAPVVYAAASPDDSFAFLDVEPSQDDAGRFGVAAASMRVARAPGSLSSGSSSASASSCVFLTNKEMADKIYEKEDLLLKDVPACQMQTINNLSHLSKDYTRKKNRVVHRFFEILASEKAEEIRNMARKHKNRNRKQRFTYELILRCGGAPDPDKQYLLSKALLCFSVQHKKDTFRTWGDDELPVVLPTGKAAADTFETEYEPNTFKTQMGMLFGWLKEQGVQYSTHHFNGGKLDIWLFLLISMFLYRLTIMFVCSNFLDGEFVAYKRKMYQDIRSVRTKFGTKSNKPTLHSSTDEVIASTTLSQPYANVLHLLQEISYKLQSRIYLRGGKEVTLLNFDQVVLSIQGTGKFKGKRKINIVGLVDKTTQITFSNTSTRDIEDFFDCVEDDSDPKCLVKLFCFLMNMCVSDQERVFCREAASVPRTVKSFEAKMKSAGMPYIKIMPKNPYGKNFMDKWVKDLCKRTGVPPPIKGKISNHGARGHGIDMQARAKTAFVEVKGASRHGGPRVHEGYQTGDTVTRDQKYEAQMLDPDRVKKNVAINKAKSPAYLIGMPDKIVPRKGTMLELKTRGILNWPVSSTPLAADPDIDHVSSRVPYQETRESEAIMHYDEQQGFVQQPAFPQPFPADVTSPYHQHHFPYHPPPHRPSHFSPPVQNNHNTYNYNNMYYTGWEQPRCPQQHRPFGPARRPPSPPRPYYRDRW